ncbi:MAG TPA: hypothetical protein DCL48_06415, partial [Alphaproteobacteria bacterium]|nr:hypothetical protein [Alphaproteobacteria bacterium]
MLSWAQGAMAPYHRPILLVSGLVYLAFGILHSVTAPAGIAVTMGPIALVSSALCFSLAAAQPLYTPWLQRNVLLPVGVIIVLNSVAHLLIQGEPQLTTNVTIALLICGIFLFRLQHFYGLVALSAAAFAAALSNGRPDPAWEHFTYHFAECLIVAIIAFHVKRGISSAVVRHQNAAIAAAAEATAQAEKAAQAATRAERAANAKAEFLANMSHEIRTPM